MWKKKEAPVTTTPPPIVLGIVVDGHLIEKFSVGTPRLASLFLSNPTFVEVDE